MLPLNDRYSRELFNCSKTAYGIAVIPILESDRVFSVELNTDVRAVMASIPICALLKSRVCSVPDTGNKASVGVKCFH